MNPNEAQDAAVTSPPDPDTGNESTEMSHDEDCIPLSSLSMPDDQEQMQNPEVGDMVNYSVEGKVTRIEGENAYVQKTAINGNKVEGGSAAPAPDEMGQLEDMAKNMPES